MNETWTNYESSIFLNQGGERKYLKHAGICEVDAKNESAELSCCWPMGSALLDIQNGDTIEITRSLFRSRDDFNPDDVIIRLLHCRVRSVKFPNIVGLDAEATMTVHVGVDCDVEIVRDD